MALRKPSKVKDIDIDEDNTGSEPAIQATKKTPPPKAKKVQPEKVAEEPITDFKEPEKVAEEPITDRQPMPVKEVVDDKGTLTTQTDTQITVTKGTFIGSEDFGELDIRFGSFPILKLDTGSFVLDEEELEGKSIDVVISQARPKYLIREVTDDDDDEAEICYSYDGVLNTSGELVSEFKANLQNQGKSVETKTYLEAVAEVVEEGEFEGEFVILSIPPASCSRFSGYRVKVARKFQCTPSGVITRLSVGKKISKGRISWNPWKFSVVGRYDG